jgi:hypothetical protein
VIFNKEEREVIAALVRGWKHMAPVVEEAARQTGLTRTDIIVMLAMAAQDSGDEDWKT